MKNEERKMENKASSLNLTLREVLQEAIHKEIEAHVMYAGLKSRVNNSSAKDALQDLAEQESTHQHILEDYLHGKLKEGILNIGMVVDYKIAEYLDQPEVSPSMELKDVFLLAANKEKASHELYLQLAAIHPNGHVKHLLEELAAQELTHKLRVEELFNEVAFPQTDGG
jgi:rubrerythrin